MLRLQKQHQLIKNGDRILELGTGWLHWEALTVRLFYDVEAVAFDVSDNRQLCGLKNYLRQLRSLLHGFDLSPTEIGRAESIINNVLEVDSFNELYRLLDFKYVVESSGKFCESVCRQVRSNWS